MKILLLGDPEGKLEREFIQRGHCVDRTVEKILRGSEADQVISYGYRHILKKDFIQQLKRPAVNLHISYLPWNRGADPNPWSHLEDTPSGVTVHAIDEGVDTGAILAQRKVHLSGGMSLRQSYEMLQSEMQSLFWECWPQIESGGAVFSPQQGKGSVHFTSDRIHFLNLIEPEGWDITIDELKRRWKNRKAGSDEK